MGTKRPTERPTDRPTKKPTVRPTDRPTKKPTSKPTRQPILPSDLEQCQDVEGFLFENRSERSCEWAGRRPRERCDRQEDEDNSFLPGEPLEVRDACPSVCDRRCSCTEESDFSREF